MIGQLITLPARLSLRGVRIATHIAEQVTGRAVSETLRVASIIEGLRPRGGSGGSSEASTAEGGSSTSNGGNGSNGGRPEAAPVTRARPSGGTTTRRRSQPTPAETRPAVPVDEAPAEEAAAEAEVTEPASTVTPPESEAAGIPTDPRRATPEPEPAPPVARTPEPVEPLASERLEAEGETVEVDLDAPDSTQEHVSEEPVLVREEAEAGAEDGAGASIHVAEPWEGYAKMTAREVVARLSTASSAELAAVQLFESGNRSRQMVLQAVQRQLRTAEHGQ